MHDELFAAQLELDDPLARLNLGRARIKGGLLSGNMPIILRVWQVNIPNT